MNTERYPHTIQIHSVTESQDSTGDITESKSEIYDGKADVQYSASFRDIVSNGLQPVKKATVMLPKSLPVKNGYEVVHDGDTGIVHGFSNLDDSLEVVFS